MSIVKLEDFFDFNAQEPINRLAYTEEDMDYKIKVIQKMQELGMNITIDEIGNICGTLKLGNGTGKTIAIGSHTDSVYDGGQYDGPVGVIVGLQTAEKLLNSDSFKGTIKVAIYSCEESSRFGNACLGSKFLNGNITTADFENIVVQKQTQDGNPITLREAIKQAKAYLFQRVDGIQEVEKIFSEEDIDYALEAHIEQYKILDKKAKKDQDWIGIITSIGSAVRVQYDVQGKADHTGSTPMKKRKNAVDSAAKIGNKVRKLGKEYEEAGQGRASQVEITTPGHNRSFNQIPDNAQGLIDFRLLGDNTPDKVLEDFNKIVKKVEKKTKTKIGVTVISKGTPVNTSEELNGIIEEVCSKSKIKSLRMPSYAGQDTGYVPTKNKTMIFIPSTGGSHNPEEKTTERAISSATEVFIKTCENLLERQTLQDRIAADTPEITTSNGMEEGIKTHEKEIVD